MDISRLQNEECRPSNPYKATESTVAGHSVSHAFVCSKSNSFLVYDY